MKIILMRRKLLRLAITILSLPILAGLHGAVAMPFSPYLKTFSGQGSQTLPLVNIRMSQSNIRAVLRDRGFRRIDFIKNRPFSYIVKACKNNSRIRIKISKWGKIKRRRIIGSCDTPRRQDVRDRSQDIDVDYDRPSRIVRPKGIRQILRARGFNRIRFTDRELPVYKVVACKRNRKMELRLSRRGSIIDRRRIGRCQNRANNQSRNLPSTSEIKEILRNRGYHRIRYTDDQLPKYVAKACKRGAKFRLTINRWGEIRRRNRIGWCSVSANRAPVRRAPRVDYDDGEIAASTRLDANTCQNYLEQIIDRKKIYFDIASSRIRRDSARLLRKLAHVMNRCPSAKIEVAGHTDSVGSDSYNHRLSHERAMSVFRRLVDLGVRRRRLLAKGYGENHPISSNATNYGKSLNRRIDFIVSWKDEDDYAGNSGDDRGYPNDRDGEDGYGGRY